MQRVTVVISIRYIQMFTKRSAIVKIISIVLRLNSTVVNLKLTLLLLTGMVLMTKAEVVQSILVAIREVEEAHQLTMVTIVELK